MARHLELSRPLVCFDLETTGLDVQNDRIVELCLVKLHPDRRREVVLERFNPQRPIPAEASAVHRIFDADVADKPTFASCASRLQGLMRGCDVAGFNVERFDLPLLTREFRRAGLTFPDAAISVVDAWRIFCQQEPRDLKGALRFYCGRELVEAHSAEADAQAALDVLEGQLERYAEMPCDVPGLHAYSHPRRPDWIDGDGKMIWQGEQAALGFGKHKGRTLREMAEREPDYLRWMSQGDFATEVRDACRDALSGVYPRKQATRPAPQSTSVAPSLGPGGQRSLF